MHLFNTIIVFIILVFDLKKFSKAEDCDLYGVLLYEDIGCIPVKTDGKSCPSKYECNLNQLKSGCQFRGKIYEPGKLINEDLTYPGCSIGCLCEGTNSINCAVLDCPEVFEDYDPSCYFKYALGECCSKERVCNSTETKKCQVDGSIYKLGQQFYPKNTCFECICNENFAGKYDEETCVRRTCNAQIHYGSQILQNCAPAYFKDQDVKCCPDDFVCPDASDSLIVVNPIGDKNSNLQDLECFFGDKKLKLGEGLKRTVNKWGKDRNLQCECMLPPFLTCIEI